MIAELFSIITENPVQLIGWGIVGGLLAQVGLMVVGGARRASFERKRGDLEQERLALEIKAARMKILVVETDKTAWNGVRKFTVTRKVLECDDTYSFYLNPHDGKPLPQFKPGQYLTFQLSVPGVAKQVVRCYSLSDIGRVTHYRVTIKRCLPPPKTEHPPGIGSSFFCDGIKEGDILDVKAPNGHFYLDMEKQRPIVLISGGIGVTPMVTMANALTEVGDSREIWFFFGARNGADHMFKEYMEEIVKKNQNVHMHVCYSKPAPTDRKGIDFQHEGRVTVDLFKELLPSNNYDYFLCGPGPFMESITSDLTDWGVPDSWVHFEAFGPASVKKKAPPPAAATGGAVAATFDVIFAKSGKTAKWDGSHDSVLSLAEENGIKIDAGCRAGGCGSCIIAIKSGNVEYAGAPPDVESGSCLSCICKPKGALVIDA